MSNVTVAHLWRQRKKDFMHEISPYIKYMAQSGFPAVLSLISFFFFIQYFQLIREFPKDFPIELVGTFLFIPLVCYSPVRTWFKEADKIYFMPLEMEFASYLHKSKVRSFSFRMIWLIAAIVIYFPIYKHSEQYIGILFVLALVFMKWINAKFAWEERRCAWHIHRLLLKTFRWIIMSTIIISLLYYGNGLTLIWFIAVMAVLWFVYRIPDKHQIPWVYLVEEEKKSYRNYIRFFSFFVDVKESEPAIKRRTYLSWLLSFIKYDRHNTFVYLNAISVIRTEIGGLLLRFIFLGCIVTYLFAYELSWNGWSAFMSLCFFLFVFSIQLESIRHTHRHSVWQHVYPILPERQHSQLTSLVKWIAYIGAFLLWCSGAIVLITHKLYNPVFAMAAVVLLFPIMRVKLLQRKLMKESQMDDD